MSDLGEAKILGVFGKRKEKPVDVGRSPEAPRYLAAQIERLMGLPLRDKADLDRWSSEYGKVQRVLIKQYPEFEFYPEVWHFFADADIRARDDEYRDRQHGLMSDYITLLRSEPQSE